MNYNMWEYKVVKINEFNLEQLLNELGKQGWELCGLREDDFVFKRNTYTYINTLHTVDPYYINPPYIITSTTSTTSTAGKTK
jgi:hypothetical protein